MKKRIAIICAVLLLIVLVVFFATRRNDVKAPSPAEEPAPVAETEAPGSEEKISEAGGTGANTQIPPKGEPAEDAEPVSGTLGGDASEGTIVNVTPDVAWTEWDEFLAMTPEEQDAFMQSFESLEAFKDWMVAAQQEWAAAHPAEEIGPGDVIHIGG